MLYRNGGWEVSINEKTGNKMRSLVDPGQPLPVFPESLDLKITDYCNAECAFCHENSTIKGKHADLLKTQMALSMLPPGVEIAIGGGDPMAWPHLDAFLQWCSSRGLFANITVNGLHMTKRNAARLKEFQDHGLVHGIGISAVSNGIERSAFNYQPEFGLKNVVGHIILGRFDFHIYAHSDIELMPAYLVLGYKKFGRGIAYAPQVERPLLEQNSLNDQLRRWIRFMRKNKVRVSFDNLALEQGEVKSFIEPEAWDKMYMGPDGMFTMFVDAVRQEWAISSTTPRPSRVSWKSESLREFFYIATTEHLCAI